VRRTRHGDAVGVGRGALGWTPISGDIRTLHDPEVAISATTKAMRARPMKATKYSVADRPLRRFLLTAVMVHHSRRCASEEFRVAKSSE